MSLFQKLTFVLSAHHLRDLPPPQGREIAFAGRSNAGKSSAINALAGRRRLAFVSKTPGRTQQINFFRLNGAFLVDLPGYGYAKVPQAIRAHWAKVLPAYLSERPSLHGLVLIMDARHPMTDLDRAMLEWFEPTGRPAHVLLSKSDKLARGEAKRTLAAIAKQLHAIAPNYSAQLFSSLSLAGVPEARAVLSGWIDVREAAGTSHGEGPTGGAHKQKPRAEGEKPGDKMP
jgi:GTP-binding protein